MGKNLGFELKEKIYENGELTVYRGIDLLTGKDIVQKCVHQHDQMKYYSDLLKKEYQLLKTIKSPYVVKPVSIIEDETLTLTTEYVAGETLRALIDQGLLSNQEKLNIAIELFKGIDSIHCYRILHKDINPTNIIWNEVTKKLTIIDFNISERAQTQKVAFSSPKHLQGTLPYISPEQTGRMNRILDYRSDYYSAGATLYELFTGKRPFECEDRSSLVHHHIAVKPVPPHEADGGVPFIISKIIMKLLSKNSEDRYQSIEGILYDLEHSVSSELAGGSFRIGSTDRYFQLNISQKIYGREETVTSLLSLFDTAQSGSFQHCFVTGYSGVGKTTVIQELYNPITSRDGFFISGKFDQYNTSTPYSGILHSIDSFINLLLVEEEDRLEAWRQRLLIALGNYIAVLVQFVPSLALIVGQQPMPPEVSGIEAQNRFNEALQRFFVAIGDDAHPIVLFLDDLQWIDSGSLMLIEGLFKNEDLKYLLFVGSYRTNEVTKGHPLQVMLAQLETGGEKIQQFHLESLELADVFQLFTDTFGVVERDTYIVEQIMKKTKGNAFYIKQLLHHFYDKKCVHFEVEKSHWLWDIQCFKEEKVSDNVADFLKDQIKSLSGIHRDILTTGACVGNVFDENILMGVLGVDQDEIIRNVELLIEENYLLSLGGMYYVFSHDQIQQAAYDSLDKKELSQRHLEIAEALEVRDEKDFSEEAIFEIAGHYRKSLALKTIFKDITQVVKYFLSAGDLASRNIAHEEALIYYEAAEQLSPKEFWQTQYEQMLLLSNKMIKTLYMLGDFDKLDNLVSQMKEKVTSPIDLATVYETKIQSLMARQDYGEGLEIMLEALKAFGMEVSLEVGPNDYEKAFGKLAVLMENRTVPSLIELPEMDDLAYVNEMELLAGIVPLLFNVAPQLLPLIILEMTFLSIEHGNCKYSSFGYAFFGTILCGSIGDVETGTQYGELALDLLHKLNATSEIPKVYMVASQHVMHYKEHLDEVIALEEKGYYKGIDLGDYTYAGFAGHGYCFNYYLAGKELSKTQRIFESYSESLEKINQGTQNLFQYIYLQTIENMRLKEESPWVMDGKWFNEEEMLPEIIEKGHQTALFVYYFNKMQLCYMFDQMELALEAADGMEQYLNGGTGLMHIPIYHQYAALIKLALYDTFDETLKHQTMQRIDEHLNYLKNLSESINYGHRYEIVLAVKICVDGQYEESRKHYESAIASVHKSGYLREEAMYRELFSKMYNLVDNKELSIYYGQSAYACYEKWGALQKLPYCLISDRKANRKNSESSIYTLHSVNTAIDMDQNLDMHSILKFSQTVAKEIVYEELLKKLLYILLENAGAQRATIINYTQEGRVVIAENHVDKDFSIQVLESLELYKELPHKVIRFANNGKKIVRLDRAISTPLFMDDPYIIEKELHSVLCFPLMNKGETIGLIYLENNLTDGVFSSQRTEFLTLLSSQIAISIENAMVYRHLEKMVEERTNDLETKNEELQQLNLQLQKISVTDGLTGLCNRRKLDEVLSYEQKKSRRYGSKLAVILLDIDRFKEVNDTYGHVIGDQVLVNFAEILIENTRKTDTVGRWGGEEFLIICPELDLAHCYVLAEKLRLLISTYNFVDIGQRTASFGVAELHSGHEVKDLIKMADDCLYEAKRSGRNKVIYVVE